MKKQAPNLNLLLIAVIAAILMIHDGYARKIAVHYIHNNYAEYMEDTSTIYEPSVGTNTLKLNNINVHILRDFLYRFKEINNEKWYAVEGGLVAMFKTGDVATMVAYKRNGEWLYSIESYNQQIMPGEVRILVKRSYNGYDILHIKEIEVPNQDSPIFLVYIQNTTTIKILRVYEGEMEILHEYIRG
jgi:hypothetical protein